MKIPIKKIIYSTLTVIFLITVICFGILIYVHGKSRDLIYEYDDISDVPSKKVAIVFGAAINPYTNLPSNVLADRIKTAAELYNAGKVEKIIMSGDNRVTHYNEPEVMKRFINQYGVQEEDVVLDYAGRRTYDTCYRAKEIFGIDEAILVTQRYHLYRAIYTCNAIGVDSVGVSASLQPYLHQTYYNLREMPAIVLAFWQVHVSRPEPVLGEKEEMFD